MSLFDRVLRDIEKNKARRENGEYISIPFPFTRFSKYIPGIQQGRYIITTANSKVGKTKFTDYLFVYGPLKWIKNKKTNISLKIFYFSLEMSKTDKMKEAIVHKLYEATNYKTMMSPEYLDSVYEDYILEDSILSDIKGYKEYFEEFQKSVTFIDNIRNPFGIYSYMRDYAHNNGSYYDKNGYKLNTQDVKNGNIDVIKNIDYYQPNNPDEFVIVITDHVGLLTPEKINGKQEDLHSAISRFSSDYCLKMRDRWNYIVVNVQQQAAAQESLEHFKLDKLQPSTEGLADNKLTQRDCDMMLGLFAPYRHKIKSHAGYNTTVLKDLQRELSVILNRRGASNISTQLLFLGSVNHFYELPKPEDIVYDNFIKFLKPKF